MTKHCKSCNEPLIEYFFFDSENSKQSLLIHPKSLDKLPCEIDGINLEVVDQAMQNRIKETAIENSSPESESVSVDYTPEIEILPAETNEDLIKRRMSEGAITLNEYDSIKERIDK